MLCANWDTLCGSLRRQSVVRDCCDAAYMGRTVARHRPKVLDADRYNSLMCTKNHALANVRCPGLWTCRAGVFSLG